MDKKLSKTEYACTKFDWASYGRYKNTFSKKKNENYLPVYTCINKNMTVTLLNLTLQAAKLQNKMLYIHKTEYCKMSVQIVTRN